MKSTALVRFAVAALLSAPLFAQAADVDSMQRCMDEFAAKNFADRNISFAIEGVTSVRLPLILSSGTRHVQLVASERNSGRVLATASCEFKGTTNAEVIVSAPVAR